MEAVESGRDGRDDGRSDDEEEEGIGESAEFAPERSVSRGEDDKVDARAGAEAERLDTLLFAFSFNFAFASIFCASAYSFAF